MLYWLDKNSENNNVIILSKKALLIGSCDRASCENVDAQLKNNANPVALLGKDKVSLIPYGAIQEITHHAAEAGSTLHCKGKRGVIQKKISFGQVDAKLKCLSFINKLQGGSLAINEERSFTVAQSAQSAPAKNKIANLVKKAKFDASWFSKKGALIGMAAAGVVGAGLIGFFVLQGSSSALYDAIQTHTLKNTNDVAKLIDEGADINYEGKDGVTPLLSALNNGDEKIAVKLIEKGADLGTDYYGQTALDVAIETSLNRAVISMLSKNASSSNKDNLLVRIIQNELDLNTVKAAHVNGGNVNYVDEDGLSVLANALLFNASNDVVEYLLKNGASTKTIVNGATPVEFAMSRGRRDLAALISHYSM